MVSKTKSGNKGKVIDLKPYLPHILLLVLVVFSYYLLLSQISSLNQRLVTFEQRMADYESSLPEEIKVKLFYDSNCTLCSNFSDMSEYLNRNHVSFDLLDISNDSNLKLAKALGIGFFPSLAIYSPDAEHSVALYKLVENKIPINTYYILRLGDVGIYPFGNETNETFFFYSETCTFSSAQKGVLQTMNLSYEPICIQMHKGDDEKCKDKWGEDNYKRFVALQSEYRIRETPTFLVNGRYLIVGYHTKTSLENILESLKNI